MAGMHFVSLEFVAELRALKPLRWQIRMLRDDPQLDGIVSNGSGLLRLRWSPGMNTKIYPYIEMKMKMLWKESSFRYSELSKFCCIEADMVWIARTCNVSFMLDTLDKI